MLCVCECVCVHACAVCPQDKPRVPRLGATSSRSPVWLRTQGDSGNPEDCVGALGEASSDGIPSVSQ